jgi:filamentous hemagglutinin
LFTGAGSLKAGGRWNPKGGFRTLYFSLTAETALAEALAQHRSQAVPDVEATPLVLVGARVSVRRLFNLTDASTRRRLGLTVARIRGPWRPAQHAGQEALTQAVGRLAREHGFQGLLAPSAARRRGVNLVLFPDRLGTHDLVAVHDEKFPLVRRRLRRK